MSPENGFNENIIDFLLCVKIFKRVVEIIFVFYRQLISHFSDQ